MNCKILCDKESKNFTKFIRTKQSLNKTVDWPVWLCSELEENTIPFPRPESKACIKFRGWQKVHRLPYISSRSMTPENKKKPRGVH